MIKNWKTTLSGLLIFALFAASHFYPQIFTDNVVASITSLLVGAGLIAAKDGTVTGIGASATTVEK